MFSLPFNTNLNSDEIANLVSVASSDEVFDVYFSTVLPPFDSDAMGQKVKSLPSEILYMVDNGVKISATFNDIGVSPSQENLDKFLYSFDTLYELGVRSLTIPHSHWVEGIKDRFDDIFVKNTVLRGVRTRADFANAFFAGFDYVNLDRNLLRDRDSLIDIVEVRDDLAKKHNRKVFLSILANEGCKGECPLMAEHYTYNCMDGANVGYFADGISDQSCKLWRGVDRSYELKVCNIPPVLSEYDGLYGLGIDVIKLHGREIASLYEESLGIIDSYKKRDEIFNYGVVKDGMPKKQLNSWVKKIRKCKSECWDCAYCDAIFDSYRMSNEEELEALLKSLNA